MAQQDAIPTIDEIRKNYPEYDDMNDSELAEAMYLKHQPDEDFESFSQEVGLDPESDRSKFAPSELRERKENMEEMSSFERGLRGGFEKTKALGAGAVSALGAAAEETIGVGEGLRDWGISEYQENMEEAQLKYPQETSFKELVKDPSLSGAAEWASYTLGDLAPTIGATLATGGVGGVASGAVKAAGKKALTKMGREVGENVVQKGVREASEKLMNRQLAKGVSREAAEKLVTRGIGTQAGMVAGGGALETGEMYGSAVEELGVEEANPFKAMALGGAAGAVELAGGNIRVLKKLFGDKVDEGVRSAIELAKRDARARPAAMQYLSKVVGEAARQAPAEMGQEATQEAMQIANMNWQDPGVREVLSEENAWRLIEAGAAGGLAGGSTGGAGTTVTEGVRRTFQEGGKEAEQAKNQVKDLEQRIENQKERRKIVSEKDQADIDKEIEKNQQQVDQLKSVINQQEGKIGYDKAAERLDQEAPQPDGKKTTTKSVRKLVKKDKITGDDFGVDEASLGKHISERQVEQIDENQDIEDQANQVLEIAKSHGKIYSDSVKKKGEKLFEPLSKEAMKAQKKGDTDRYNKIVKIGSSLRQELGISNEDGKFDYERIRKEAEEEVAYEIRGQQQEKYERQRQKEVDPFEGVPDETDPSYSLGEGFQQVSATVDNVIQGKSKDPVSELRHLWENVGDSKNRREEGFSPEGFVKSINSLASARAQYRDDRQEAEARVIESLKEWQSENAADLELDVSGMDTDANKAWQEGGQLGKVQAGSRYAYLVSGLDYLQHATDKNGKPVVESSIAPELDVAPETAREVMDLEKRQIIQDAGMWDNDFNEAISEDISKWSDAEKKNLAGETVGILKKRAKAYEKLKRTSKNPQQDYRQIVSEFDRAAYKSGSSMGNDPKAELERIKSDYVETQAQLKALEKQGAPKAKSGGQAVKVERRSNISRNDLQNEPNTVFLFGDNLQGKGKKGQAAAMRGEPNAIGIPTKKQPSNEQGAFFTDEEFEKNKQAIDQAFAKIPAGSKVVIPEQGLGTGNARLKEKAPRTYKYLQNKIAELASIEGEADISSKKTLRNRLYSLTMEAQRPKYMHPHIRDIRPTPLRATDEKAQKNKEQKDKLQKGFNNRRNYAAKALANRMLALKLDFDRDDMDRSENTKKPENNPIFYRTGNAYVMRSVSDDRLPSLDRLENDISRMINENIFAIDDFQHVIGTPELMGAVAHQYVDQQALKENALQPYWTDIIDRAAVRFEELHERSKNAETEEAALSILGEFSATIDPLLDRIETKNLVEAISSELLNHRNQEVRDAYRKALKSRSALKDLFVKGKRNFDVNNHIKNAENLKVDFRKHATPLNPGRMNQAEIERRQKLLDEGRISSIFPKAEKEFESGFREWLVLDTLRRNPSFNAVKATKEHRHPAVDDEVRQNLARGIANIQSMDVLTNNLSQEEQELLRNALRTQNTGVIPRSLAQKAYEKSETARLQIEADRQAVKDQAKEDTDFLLSSETQEKLAQNPKQKDQAGFYDKLYSIAKKAFSAAGVHLQVEPRRVTASGGTLKAQRGIKNTPEIGGVSYLKYDGDIVSMSPMGQKYVVIGFEDALDQQLSDEDVQRMEERGYEDSVEEALFSPEWAEALGLEEEQGQGREEKEPPTSRIKLQNLSTGETSTIAVGTEVTRHPRLDHYFNFRFQENNELRNFYENALREAYRYEREQQRKSRGENAMMARAEIMRDENNNEFLRFYPDYRGVYFEDHAIVSDEQMTNYASKDKAQAAQQQAVGIERARQLDKMTRAIQEQGKLPTDLATMELDQLATMEPTGAESQAAEGEELSFTGEALANNAFAADRQPDSELGEGKTGEDDDAPDRSDRQGMTGGTGARLSREERENEEFRNIENLTEQDSIDLDKVADNLETIARQMPESYQYRFKLMEQAFRGKAGKTEGTKQEVDQAERTEHVKEMIRQHKGLNKNQKDRVWAIYKNEGEQAGNREAVRATIEHEIGAKYGQEAKQKLWDLKKKRPQEYVEQIQKAMNEMKAKGPFTNEFHTVEPERFEESLVMAVADKPLNQEDKDLLKSGLEKAASDMDSPFGSEDHLEAMKAQIDQASEVGDLLENAATYDPGKAFAREDSASEKGSAVPIDNQMSDTWGDIHGKRSPLHRAVFDVLDENGESVADRKGLSYKVEMDDGSVVKMRASELNQMTEDKARPRSILGFETIEERTDPATGENGAKKYEISVKQEAQLTDAEREAFDAGYEAHITQSAKARAEVRGYRTERGLEVQIGGRWYHVVPDDTAIKDFHLDDLRQAARSSEKKAEGKESRPGAAWQTEDFIVDNHFLGYSLSDTAQPRTLKRDIDRQQITKNLNDIAEKVAGGSRNVYVHNTPYDGTVPRSVRQQLEKDGVTGFVKGLYDPKTNTAHVFLSRHADKDGNVDKRSLTKTMLHETVAHSGLTSMFQTNKEYRKFLFNDVYRNYKNEIGVDPNQTDKENMRRIEEFLAGKIEQTEIVEDKNGNQKFVNPEINTWFDKIASFVVQAARKIANQLGTTIRMTQPEIRETVAKTFKGLDVKRTHGLGHMIPGKFKPMKNLPAYRDFMNYEENIGDTFLRKIEDAHRWFVNLKESQRKQGIQLKDKEDTEAWLRLYPGLVDAHLQTVNDREQWILNQMAKQKIGMEDLAKYLNAKSALEKNEKIRRDSEAEKIPAPKPSQNEIDAGASGIYDSTANRWLQEIRNEGKEEKIHKLADQVWKTNNEFLDNLAFYGLKSKEEVEKMRNTFDHFVPFGSDETWESASEGPSGMSGRTDLVSGLAPHKSLDSNPFALTFFRAKDAIVQGEKNRVKQALGNQIYNHPHSQLFEMYLPEAEVQRLQDQMGYSNQEMTDWLFNRGLHSQAEIQGSIEDQIKENDLIPVRYDGQENYIRIHHDGLRRAFLQEGVVRGGKVVKAFGGLSRWLVMANTMLNPEFMYTNLLRDVGTAVGNTITMQQLGQRKDTNQVAKELGKSVTSAMRGIYNYNFGDGSHEWAGWYKDYANNGGKIGQPFLGVKDPQELAEKMQREVAKGSGGGLVSALTRNKDSLMSFVTKFNETFENASRVSAYKVAVENGVSKPQAARMSRELTVDFNRKGELGQLMNTFYLFSNAGVGGTARILRGLMNNKQKAGKVMGSIALGGFTMALMNRFAGGEDEDGRWRFEKINRDNRSRHMIFMVPGSDGDYVKIPLPYGFGFFYDTGQLLADYAMGERGRDELTTAGMIAGSATHNFNPFSAAGELNSAHGWLQLMSPTLADPIVDISMENTQFGSPLMPTPEYKGQPDSQRHWDSVGTVSKEVTQWLNEITGGAPEVPGAVDISPETMDYMLETFGGSAGRFWMQRLPGYISAKMQGKEMNYNDAPGIRRVMGEPFDWQNRKLFNESVYAVQSAADRLDNMKKRLEYAKTESARRDAQETIRQYQKENRDLLALDELRKQTFDRIKQLDTQKEKIRKSGQSQAKKDEMLSRIDDTQYRLMKQFNSRFLDSVK